MAKFVKARGSSRLLIPHIESFLARGRFPEELPLGVRMNKPADTAFHPSSREDTLACPRAMYAVRKRMHEGYWVGPRSRGNTDVGSIKNFLVGHMWHELLQWVTVDGLGFATWDDVEDAHAVTSEGRRFDQDSAEECIEVDQLVRAGGWWGKGSMDISHCVIPEHGEFVVDFKTCGSYPFKSAVAPYDSYVAQLQIYMDWADVERGIILYVNKDSGHDFKEFVIERDGSVADEIYRKWDLVSRAVVEGSAPECECEMSGCLTG